MIENNISKNELEGINWISQHEFLQSMLPYDLKDDPYFANKYFNYYKKGDFTMSYPDEFGEDIRIFKDGDLIFEGDCKSIEDLLDIEKKLNI